MQDRKSERSQIIIPRSLTFDEQGRLYVADSIGRLRRCTFSCDGDSGVDAVIDGVSPAVGTIIPN